MGMGLNIKILEKAKKFANIIERQEKINILTHCDADGIAGAAIAKKVLDEIGIKNEIKAVKYFKKEYINSEEFFWLIDLGNEYIRSCNCIITDHHYMNSFNENILNPYQYGINGEYEISGAGLAYLVASCFDSKYADLAIIGAIGDLQDLKFRKLVGINREILKKSNIEIKRDLRIYGRERPLYRMLSYSADPIIPPFFKKEKNSIIFLKKIGIDYNKRWIELNKEEKKKLFSSLVRLLIEEGFGYKYIERLFGEVYELNGKDVRQYSTILNSLAKYGNWEVGIKACIEGNFDMEKLLKQHKKKLKKYIEYANKKIREYENIYYFHGKDYILDTIVGTVAGILLKENKICCPIVAFAENEEGIKISVRAPPDLSLNLSKAIKKATKMIGGDGGGHACAAGGTIPKGMEESFLKVFNEEIKHQLIL